MSKLVMGQLTWPELAAELDHIKVALVPVGSCWFLRATRPQYDLYY